MHRILRLLLVFLIQIGLDVVDFALDHVDLLGLTGKFGSACLQIGSALEDFLLDDDSLFSGFEFFEGDLLVDGGATLRVRVLLLAHAGQHGVLLLLQD